MTDTELSLKIEFRDRLEVSKDTRNFDRMKMTFINELYFVAVDNKVPLEPEILLEMEVPQ